MGSVHWKCLTLNRGRAVILDGLFSTPVGHHLITFNAVTIFPAFYQRTRKQPAHARSRARRSSIRLPPSISPTSARKQRSLSQVGLRAAGQAIDSAWRRHSGSLCQHHSMENDGEQSSRRRRGVFCDGPRRHECVHALCAVKCDMCAEAAPRLASHAT